MIVIYDVVYVEGVGTPSYMVVVGYDGTERRHRLAHRIKNVTQQLVPGLNPDLVKEFMRGAEDLRVSMGDEDVRLNWYCRNCYQYQLVPAVEQQKPCCQSCRHSEDWWETLLHNVSKAFSMREAFDTLDGAGSPPLNRGLRPFVSRSMV